VHQRLSRAVPKVEEAQKKSSVQLSVKVESPSPPNSPATVTSSREVARCSPIGQRKRRGFLEQETLPAIETQQPAPLVLTSENIVSDGDHPEPTNYNNSAPPQSSEEEHTNLLSFQKEMKPLMGYQFSLRTTGTGFRIVTYIIVHRKVILTTFSKIKYEYIILPSARSHTSIPPASTSILFQRSWVLILSVF
jgi:hypothetical protein